MVNIRFKLAGFVFVLAIVAIMGRLFYWQVIRGEELMQDARGQYVSGTRILAKRGSVLSSEGEWLVSSADSWLMFAQLPEMREDVRTVANKLALVLVDDQDENYKDLLLERAIEIEQVLLRDGVVWVPLERGVDTETKRNIEALKIRGIGFDLEETRIYPEASSSAHVLGFVGKDDTGEDKGYFGLEGQYDLLLSGSHGYLERESSAVGMPLLTGDARENAAKGGVDLVTYISKPVQLLVERRLKRAMEQYGAVSGSVVVIDPTSGGVVAMAAEPAYDPATYFDFGNSYFKNPMISDGFEPGSIFKPVVMAAGLDAGLVKPDTKCDICGEPLKIDKYEIGTWNNEYRENATMTEVIQHSDNVGMAFVGGELGREQMEGYLRAFGFGRLTGIDLQGEMTPKMRDRWSLVDVATASFGQGIAVTPIQMVMAIATIARGGESIEPQVVDYLAQGDWQEERRPQVGQRVISEEAAEEITKMMVVAASDGEAKWTADTKLRVAGKTGTAQIPVKGHYDEEKTIASFVGFAPYDRPKFVMLVTLREPSTSPWASETAAPLWFGIAREMMRYLD